MSESAVDFPGAHNYSFTTERLLFRPLRLDDTADARQPETQESQAKDWIKARLASNCYLSFCIEELPGTEDDKSDKQQRQVIGLCGGTTLPEIGYIFRPAVWGRGYAQEALKGFIKFYWDTFPDGHPLIPKAEDKKYLMAITGPAEGSPTSAASIAVLKKCGFEYWKDQMEKESLGNLGEGEIMLPVWRRWGPGHSPGSPHDD
ncbi:MAG: hypothetical protein L6R41_008244 [Letrouitia leprolyta]|nr:MAG: hypothetical protein L6R41_008244 [Letrouitia leprolyta]